MDPKSGLCRVCLAVLADTAKVMPQKNGYRKHHRNPSSFTDAKLAGCKLCVAYFRLLPLEIQESLESGSPLPGESTRDRSMPFMQCRLFPKPNIDAFRHFADGSCGWMPSIVGPLYADQYQASWTIVPEDDKTDVRDVVWSNTGSVEALDLAKSWLHTCTHSHDACKDALDKAWYPTRLLDLSDPDSVRLVDTASSPVFGPFITLSYRWGEEGFYQLNTKTKATLFAGVPRAQLPLLFQDMFDTCKLFDCNLAWIDGLCIQQDDEKDWERESQQMGKVYASAYCNVSATAGGSSRQSLFRTRDYASLQRLWFKITPAFASQTFPPGRYDVIETDYYQDELDRAPLHSRAWVVQERFLAKRVLHFGEREMMWECPCLTATESWPEGLPYIPTGPFKIAVHVTDQLDPTARSKKWQNVLMAYMRGALTYADDRAIAISGVAKFFQPLLQDQYLLGMWRRTLLTDLLWHVFETKPRASTRAAKKHAHPSYSPFSVEKAINAITLADVVSCETHVEILNIDSLFEGGSRPATAVPLILRGLLRKVSLVSYAGPDGSGERAADRSVAIDGDIWDTIVVFPDYGRDNLSTMTQEHEEHFLLPFLTSQEVYYSWLMGWIIEPLQSTPNAFRRIGYFCSHPKGAAAFSRLFPGQTNDPAQMRSLPGVGSERHTFHIH